MFGLGWGEVVVIGIVALIAIGPKELPTVLRTLAQTMGKVRRMAAEFQGQFHEALREAELTDLKKHADDIVSDVTNFDPLAETKQEIEKTTRDIEKSFEMPDPLSDTAHAESAAASAALAPMAEQAGAAAVPDGATIPAAAIPSADLPRIDVPLPDALAPVTEKDFLPATPAKEAAAQETSKEPPAETSKQAGGKS